MSVLALVPSAPDVAARDILQMKEKMVDYWNAVAIINASSFAIAKTQLSSLDDDGPAPAWWNTLSVNFGNCRNHAQHWIDTVYPSLTRVPQTIVSYNTFFSVTSHSIADLLKRFARRTPTAQEKAEVQAKLQLLLTRLGASKAQVNAVRADIQTFTDQLAGDRAALTTGAASITEALGQDKEKVKKINELIEQLRAEVKALEQKIALSTVGLGISIVIGLVGFLYGGPIMLVIGILGAGASIAATVVLEGQLREISDKITAEMNRLGPIQRRIVSLNVIDSSVKHLAGAIDEINANVDVVARTWEGLESDLGGIVTKLTSARDEDWADIIQKGIDIGAAQEAWKHLDTFAKELQKIQMVFDPAEPAVNAA